MDAKHAMTENIFTGGGQEIITISTTICGSFVYLSIILIIFPQVLVTTTILK